jgi:hypothetical protein
MMIKLDNVLLTLHLRACTRAAWLPASSSYQLGKVHAFLPIHGHGDEQRDRWCRTEGAGLGEMHS